MGSGMTKVAFVVLSMAVFLSACTDSETAGETNTVVTQDTISLQKNSDVYATWDDFYKQDDATFSIDSFMLTDTFPGKMLIQTFKPTDSFYNLFGSLLVYNSDSSAFIDCYSSSWIIEKDNKGVLNAREAEVDQEVAVINTKTNIRTRVFFCGPSCQVQKAFWYNDDIVGIMGLMTEYADEFYTPTIWFVDIHNGLTIPYQHHSSVSLVHADDFVKKYMESKGVKVLY